MMPRVIHFEIGAEQPERAAKFYADIFGWDIKKWDGPMPYWLVTTGPCEAPGINGGIFVRQGPVGHVDTIDVPSVDDFVAKITAAGGQCVVPKMPIPGIGWLVYCKDTEDSIFGIMQADTGAK